MSANAPAATPTAPAATADQPTQTAATSTTTTETAQQPAMAPFKLGPWLKNAWADLLMGAIVGAAIATCICLNLPPPKPWYRKIF